LFRIVPHQIQPSLQACEAAGGFVVFEGRVRNRNEGRPVLRLEYEAFGPLAEKEGQRVVEEALQRFEVEGVRCEHRVGLLELGEVAVRVEVAAAHRDAAFAACRYVIDEIKKRVPIWKKEHYADGASEWVNGAQPPPGETADLYYSRQTRLPEVGPEGQQKLSQARVLVVGAGGLGSAALQYLAGAGVGTIGVCDFDRLELHNLHRQPLYRAEDVGKPKAELAARQLRALNPMIEVRTHPLLLDHAHQEILNEYDYVLDCTDNFAAKFLLNDLCVEAGKPLVQASIYRFEGQIHVWRPSTAEPGGGCLRCLWPAEPDEGCVGSCAEVGILGPVAGLFGTLQATECLKLILDMPDVLDRHLLQIDLKSYEMRKLRRPKSPQCPVCSAAASRKSSMVGNGPGFTVEGHWEISAEEALQIVRDGAALIDVREEFELPKLPSGLAQELPMSRMTVHDVHGPTVLICAHGVRTARLAVQLRQLGHAQTWSVRGGVPDMLMELEKCRL
jgi:sulfur-carrier protein adenylyltransferase/sulfurtransferase